MNTITLDNSTYQQVETYAKLNNLDIAEVVRNSILAFLKKLTSSKTVSQEQKKELPAHLKNMKGILAGVSDKNDDKLNYLLEKYK